MITSLFGTLGRYLFVRFLLSILSVLGIVYLLILIIDTVEVFRSASSSSNSSLLLIATVAFMRAPVVAEQVIPFATLFGAMLAFLNLSRRLELVVIRASGTSVWQFILPALAAASVIGIFAVLVFNPVSAQLKAKADDITFKSIKMRQIKGEEIWLRQKTDEGNAVIRAYRASNTEPVFSNMAIFSFDPTGRFIERYHAEKAELVDANWQLSNVRVIAPGNEIQISPQMTYSTNLTRDQVKKSLTPPDTISFYELPDWADRLTASGLDANRYIQQYKGLLARPLLLMAMILVAASVSLRFSRFGANGKAVLAGIASGFALYIVNKISNDLGAFGTFSTSFAAFFPPVLAGLLGTLVLLHQEDG